MTNNEKRYVSTRKLDVEHETPDDWGFTLPELIIKEHPGLSIEGSDAISNVIRRYRSDKTMASCCIADECMAVVLSILGIKKEG